MTCRGEPLLLTPPLSLSAGARGVSISTQESAPSQVCRARSALRPRSLCTPLWGPSPARTASGPFWVHCKDKCGVRFRFRRGTACGCTSACAGATRPSLPAVCQGLGAVPGAGLPPPRASRECPYRCKASDPIPGTPMASPPPAPPHPPPAACTAPCAVMPAASALSYSRTRTYPAVLEKVHTGDTPYKRSICRSFASPRNLLQHQISVGMDAGRGEEEGPSCP